MESKIDRKICGTCIYWNGHREIVARKNKVAILDESGVCRSLISSKSGEERRKDLCCKCYENFNVE